MTSSPSRSRTRRRISGGFATTSPGTSAVGRGSLTRLGIGGSRSPSHLKCLHAHVAFALARPGYELGDRMLAEVIDPWPGERCCSESLGGDD